MGVVESDSVKSAKKAKRKLHKACERASETRERTLLLAHMLFLQWNVYLNLP